MAEQMEVHGIVEIPMKEGCSSETSLREQMEPLLHNMPNNVLEEYTTATNSSSSKKRSLVWTHFNRSNENQAVCDICNENVTSSGNTTNMVKVSNMLHPCIYLHINILAAINLGLNPIMP